MDILNNTIRQKFNNRMIKNRFVDSLIYNVSSNNTIYEKLQFKMWLFSKKTNYISNVDPILIGGCPRSGTTLLRALIGMHPDFAAPKKEYNVFIGKNNDDILKNILGFSSDEIIKLKKPWKNIVYFSEKVLKNYMKKSGKKRIVLKLPYYIIYINELFHYFPNAKFIHLIRDGRDVSCSLRTHPKWKIENGMIKQTNLKNSFKWCVRRWVTCLNCGIKWKKSKNYFEIKYEDLVNNTINVMSELFEFLNVKKIPDNDLLSFYKYEKNEDHVQNIEVGKKIYKNSIGRWKKDMSKDEVVLFKKMAGKLLVDLEYEKNSNWN